MARPSKTQQFAIYQDTHIPHTPPRDPSFDDTRDDDLDDIIETLNLLPTDDDGRRESAVSSLPESSSETDVDYSLPMHKPYTPPMIRPSFRKPESVYSIYSRSASKRYLPRSRTGTPRSVRTSAKGSPLARKAEEEEQTEHPLVLLHVTLLPVELRWSAESMQEVLPPYTLENLQLLRSKVSETILQRGILIPHPRHEYDLLEERLLEALELKKERVTKCGHFRGRGSASSSEGSVDSGVGSSVHDSDNEVCLTCCSPVKAAGGGIGKGKYKWSIKVFAANGLMRSSAWSAAWSEMERVDVEILPWINEELRKQLDAKLAEEELEVRRREEETRIRGVVEERVRIAYDERKVADTNRKDDDVHLNGPFIEAPEKEPGVDMFSTPTVEFEEPVSDLPPVYARKDIPLSLLLKNYVFLLAQDKKNIAIFGLAVLALWMSLRSALAPNVDISALPPVQGAPNASILPARQHVRVEVLEDVTVGVEIAEDVNQTDALEAGDIENLSDGLQVANASEATDMPSSDISLTDESEVSAIENATSGICENPASRSVVFWEVAGGGIVS